MASASIMSVRGMSHPAKLRPWLNEKDGRVYVTTYKGSGNPDDPKNYRHQPIQTYSPSMQTNSTLMRDEWRLIDETAIATRKDRLQGIQRLQDAGLVRNLTNPMAYTEYEWKQKQVDATATVTMDPVDRGQGDRPDYQYQRTPIPIIMSDFEITQRELEISRNMGTDLQTDMVQEATRAVNEKLEDMMFSNEKYTLETGLEIVSLVNSGKEAGTGSLRGKWDDSATTAEDIKNDVLDMQKDARSNRYYGPYRLFITKEYEHAIKDFYDVSGASAMSIRNVLENDNDISGITAVDRLPADTVLLVQEDSETVRLLDGMGPQVVEWQANGPYVTNYKVIRIAVPQIRWTANDVTGIVKYTG